MSVVYDEGEGWARGKRVGERLEGRVRVAFGAVQRAGGCGFIGANEATAKGAKETRSLTALR